MTFTSRSPDETRRLGRRLGRLLQGGDVVGLVGELGTGKTLLVRGIAEGMGLSGRCVASPTFVLLREYPGPLSLYHLDLYRVDDAAALADLDVEALVDQRHAVVVEWAERLSLGPGFFTLSITLRHRGPEERDLELEGHGARGDQLLASLAGMGEEFSHAG